MRSSQVALANEYWRRYSLAHPFLQFPHHHRCLVVDDVAIEQSCVVEVVEGLLDGVGALGAVGGKGGQIVGFEEVDVVVDVGKLLVGDFVGHEICKDFLRPHVVEPAHGDEVAKPQMGGLVGNEVEAVHLFIGRGVLAQEDRLVAQLDAAGVLHAAKLIPGEDDESMLLKGLADAGVVFHPAQGQSGLVEDDGQLGDLRGVGLAVEDGDFTAVALGGLLLEPPCGEGEQIGGEGVAESETAGFPAILCLTCGQCRDFFFLRHGGVADGGPLLGQGERQFIAGLDVGLVETGEGAAGMVGDEQGVHVVGIAVECLVVTDKPYGYLILAFRREKSTGNDDVLVADFRLQLLAVDDNRLFDAALEVELQRLCLGLFALLAFPHKMDFHRAGHGGLGTGRQVEGQMVGHVAHLVDTGLGECMTHAGGDRHFRTCSGCHKQKERHKETSNRFHSHHKHLFILICL